MLEVAGRNRLRFLILLLAAAFFIRYGAVLALRDWHKGPGLEFGADGVDFNELALQVAAGHGFSWPTGQATSFRAPGFPFVLAGVYALSGNSYPAAYLSFCLMGALACLFIYLMMRELVAERGARIAAVLSAAYIPHIYLATVFSSESSFIPCLAAGLWLFIRYLKQGPLWLLALAGLVFGWSALTRPFAVLLLPALLATLVWSQRAKRWTALVHAFVLTVLFTAVLAPWTIRNYAVHGRFVLVATNGGSTFYGGNNIRVLKEWRHWGGWLSTTQLPGRNLIDATPDEVSHDQMEWRLGRQWLSQNLASAPLLGLYKLARLWLPDVDSRNTKYVLLQAAGYTPFLLLFVFGLWRLLRNGVCWTAPWLALHGATLATVLTALIFWGSPRFRDANLAPLMAYAALGWETLFPRKDNRV